LGVDHSDVDRPPHLTRGRAIEVISPLQHDIPFALRRAVVLARCFGNRCSPAIFQVGSDAVEQVAIASVKMGQRLIAEGVFGNGPSDRNECCQSIRIAATIEAIGTQGHSGIDDPEHGFQGVDLYARH